MKSRSSDLLKVAGHIILRILLFPVVLCSLGTGCKKDPQKHNRYSEWIFNGQTHRSNNVEAETTSDDPKAGGGNTIVGLYCHDAGNRFALSFSGDELPITGSWALKYGIDFKGVSFHVDTMYYRLSPHTTNSLTATEDNGKASYHMPPIWLYRPYDPNDSVLVQGTFNEP